MKPLVSVLIPAYNSSSWIAATINSAMEQTWSRKEIVIVDDGSTDDTFEIASQFASAQTLVIRQENQGASAARNTALAHCQGDYIQWLDADDLISCDKIALQMEAVERDASTSALVSSGWAEFLSRPQRAVFVPTLLWTDLAPAEWLIRKMNLNLHMQTATWLVSRELTTAAGPWDTRLVIDDDGEYFCRVLMASSGVRFVPDARTYYRMSGYSSVSYLGDSRSKLEAQLLSMKLHMQYLRSLEKSERVDAACLSYLTTWYPYFFPEHPDLVAELQCLARQAGGNLVEPALSWKYDWLRKLFGWRVAKNAQALLPRLKWSALIAWDRLCSRWNESNVLP